MALSLLYPEKEKGFGRDIADASDPKAIAAAQFLSQADPALIDTVWRGNPSFAGSNVGRDNFLDRIYETSAGRAPNVANPQEVAQPAPPRGLNPLDQAMQGVTPRTFLPSSAPEPQAPIDPAFVQGAEDAIRGWEDRTMRGAAENTRASAAAVQFPRPPIQAPRETAREMRIQAGGADPRFPFAEAATPSDDGREVILDYSDGSTTFNDAKTGERNSIMYTGSSIDDLRRAAEKTGETVPESNEDALVTAVITDPSGKIIGSRKSYRSAEDAQAASLAADPTRLMAASDRDRENAEESNKKPKKG